MIQIYLSSDDSQHSNSILVQQKILFPRYCLLHVHLHTGSIYLAI